MGSGATVATGAGAGAAGTGGAVGAGAGAGGAAGGGEAVADGGPVGFPVPGLLGWLFWSLGRSPHTNPQPGPVPPLSACAGAAVDKPAVSASTVIVAAAMPPGVEKDRIMVTFVDGTRHPSAAN